STTNLPHFPLLSILPFSFFSFNDPATSEIHSLSLHDALPIWSSVSGRPGAAVRLAQDTRHQPVAARLREPRGPTSRDSGHVLGIDRKSTRLNSSHVAISYAVFCLKKKKK